MFCWFGPRVCKNWYLCVTLIMLFSSKYFTKVTLWDHEKKTFSSNLVDTRSLKMIGHGIRDNYNINSSSWLFTGFGVCMMPQKCDFYIEKNTGPHKVLIFWNSLAILHKVIFNLGSKLKGGIMVSLAYWTSLYSSNQIISCAVCLWDATKDGKDGIIIPPGMYDYLSGDIVTLVLATKDGTAHAMWNLFLN